MLLLNGMGIGYMYIDESVIEERLVKDRDHILESQRVAAKTGSKYSNKSNIIVLGMQICKL
ncbi:MAG: hypothetical protein AB8B66_01820 [Rickettsiaceae bacterium]